MARSYVKSGKYEKKYKIIRITDGKPVAVIQSNKIARIVLKVLIEQNGKGKFKIENYNAFTS